MCESTVYLEVGNEAKEIMTDVARIVMDGEDAVCTNIVGEKVVLNKVRLKEANLLSHGIVFTRD